MAPRAPDDHADRVADATALLEELLDGPEGLARLDEPARRRLLEAAGRLSRPTPEERRRRAKAFRRRDRDERREADERHLDSTGIREMRRAPVFVTPPALAPELGAEEAGPRADEGPELLETRKCYVCKAPFARLHHFYDQMCGPCGDFNFAKRHPQGDLLGRVALVTGARVKIGYQAAILLLRAGAFVVVSTRFPRDAARRYAREPDFAAFRDRLRIVGLDLRHTPSVEALCQHLDATLPRLDFILHNACQTVRRPSGFYRHLMEAEQAPFAALPSPERTLLDDYAALTASHDRKADALLAGRVAPKDVVGLTHAPELSQLALTPEDLVAGAHLFPTGALDQDEQQIDLRDHNSWRLTLAEVPTVELLEVFLVNAAAPFVMNARLKPLMLRTPGRDKHIVNVSAVEGQFYREHKTDKHPHTNMAKAALNMMTRTAAADYVKDGIHMNSVDTGWVTDEDPAELAARKREEHRFHPPLDIVDGAARIVDPIFDGLATGEHLWGQFLKDYRPVPW